MGIKYSKYTLTAKANLNRFNITTREGCYFSLDDKYFLDYCPWIQFGDVGVADIISGIKESKKLPQLFEKLFVLDEYKIRTQFPSFLNHDFNAKNKSDYVKIKCNAEIDIQSLLSSFTTQTKLRLDFNNSLTHSKFLEIFNDIDEQQKSRIEYIEDPYLFDCEGWSFIQELGFNLATDRNPSNDISKIFIYKPGIDTLKPSLDNTKVIYSSYMGSELNTLHTYFSAAQTADLSLRHGIYLPALFSQGFEVLKNIHSDRYTVDKVNMMNLYSQLQNREWTCLI